MIGRFPGPRDEAQRRACWLLEEVEKLSRFADRECELMEQMRPDDPYIAVGSFADNVGTVLMHVLPYLREQAGMTHQLYSTFVLLNLYSLAEGDW